MPDVTVTVPTASVARVKSAWVGYFKLDPNITNADLLVHIKTHFAQNVRDIVRSWEGDGAARVAREAINSDGVAS